MISLQGLRRKEQEEQEALRQRALAEQQGRSAQVSGWSLGEPDDERQVRHGVLKFARFLHG